MGDHDTDVAEYLYKAGATRAGVVKLLCKDLSKACVGKLPRLPKVLLVTSQTLILHVYLIDITYIAGISLSLANASVEGRIDGHADLFVSKFEIAVDIIIWVCSFQFQLLVNC